MWLPDQFYQFGLNAYGYVGDGGLAIHRGDVPIAKTENPEIYRTERFNFTGYRFRVPNGTYTVKLHWAEGFRFGTQIAFDVAVEGETLLKNYDFHKDAGAFRTAYVRDLPGIRVTDGELALDFSPRRHFRVHGIEVVPE